MSGVALALGAGQAAAQTFTADESFGDDGVTIVAAATEGEEMPVTVAVRAKVDPPADPADDQAGGRTVTVYLQARLFNPGEDGYDAQNQAEDSNYAFHEAESERQIEFPSDTDGQFVEVSTTFTGYTLQDPDAENEVFKVTANLSGAMTGARDAPALIERDGTSSAGADDYRLDPMTVTIEARAMSGHTLVEAVEDGTAEEGEVLTLSRWSTACRCPTSP